MYIQLAVNICIHSLFYLFCFFVFFAGCTETCSCSISETPSCALLPSGPSPDTSSAPRPLLSSDDDTPTPSPYHAASFYGARRPSNSTLYESLYYTGSQSSSRSSNSHQSRGLPPLPSRSERFRIYFSNDRRTGGVMGSGGRRPHHLHHHPHLHTHHPPSNSSSPSRRGVSLEAPPPSEVDPLYENM